VLLSPTKLHKQKPASVIYEEIEGENASGDKNPQRAKEVNPGTKK